MPTQRFEGKRVEERMGEEVRERGREKGRERKSAHTWERKRAMLLLLNGLIFTQS